MDHPISRAFADADMTLPPSHQYEVLVVALGDQPGFGKRYRDEFSCELTLNECWCAYRVKPLGRRGGAPKETSDVMLEGGAFR